MNVKLTMELGFLLRGYLLSLWRVSSLNNVTLTACVKMAGDSLPQGPTGHMLSAHKLSFFAVERFPQWK